MKQKLLVLCGGQSSEHIVSRMSCTSVLNNLNKDKYELTLAFAFPVLIKIIDIPKLKVKTIDITSSAYFL